MKKDDARILWNIDDDGKICDLEVGEWSKETRSDFLYNKFRKDVGNCCSWWYNVTIEDIIYYFFLVNEFKNAEIREKSVNELRRIDEFKDKILDMQSRITPYIMR